MAGNFILSARIRRLPQLFFVAAAGLYCRGASGVDDEKALPASCDRPARHAYLGGNGDEAVDRPSRTEFHREHRLDDRPPARAGTRGPAAAGRDVAAKLPREWTRHGRGPP